jgi:hypothetical protein
LSGIRYTIDEDEYKSLPYKNNGSFENNQYELKYSTFNGVEFYNKINTNKLL